MKFEKGQLVLIDRYFNRKAPGIVIKPCKNTRGWYWVLDVVENKRSAVHWQHMVLLEGTQSEV